MTALGCDTAQVTALDAGFAVVELEENEACKGCGARAFCSPDGAKKRLRVLNSLEVQVGDQVAIELDHRQHLMMASMHYGLPLAGFVAGVLAGAALCRQELYGLPAELWQFLCGAAGLAIAGVAAAGWSRQLSGRDLQFARMVQKL